MALLQRYDIAIERQDYHAALICTVLANINRNPKRTPRAFAPVDFMPGVAAKATGPTPVDEDHLDDLLALGASLGAEVKVAR